MIATNRIQMKRPALVLGLLVLWVLQPTLDATAQSQDDRAVQFNSLEPKVQQEGMVNVIVVVDASSGKRASTRQRLERISLNQVQSYVNFPLAALQVDGAGLEALQQDPDIIGIQEDVAVPPSLAESTVLIGANTAWSSGYTGDGQTIAILDSGFDLDHKFLQANIVAEACFSRNVNGTSTSLCPNGQDSQTGTGSSIACDPDTIGHGCLHGTGVAGVAAGKDDGTVGFDGVAPDAKLITINVFSDHGSGNVLSWSSDYIAGLDHVYSLRNTYTIAAANMSLGGGKYTSETACDNANTAAKIATDQLATAGIAVIAASGNDGYTGSTGAPGCVSTIINVGSTTKADGISSFSNHANFVDLLAPGSSIMTSYTLDDGFASVNGTSFASPTVAGAWALVREASPNATIEQILAAFQSTGESITGRSAVAALPRIRVDEAIRELSCGYAWQLELRVRDGAKRIRNLGIGQSALNTDEIDEDCNEEKLPPNPPFSAFSASLEIPDGSAYTTHDYRSTAQDTAQWKLHVSGKHPYTIYWDPDDLPDGIFWLRDNVDGSIADVNMKEATFYRLANKKVRELIIERYEAGTCSNIVVTKGWNMVSLPVTPLDARKAAVFNSSRLVIYGFNGSYTLPTTLHPGEGYWVNFPRGTTYTVCGHTAGTTVDVSSGWNIIGGHDVNMAAADLTTTPGSIITADFFRYNGGFEATDSLKAGIAYWAKASTDGVINVQTAGKQSNTIRRNPVDAQIMSVSNRPVDEAWAQVRFEDTDGLAQTLFLSPQPLSEDDQYLFQLPPVAPGPVFDVRFINDLQVTDLSQASDTLIVQAHSPLTVSASNADHFTVHLYDPAQNEYLRLSPGNQFTLPPGRSLMILTATPVSVSTESPIETPGEVALLQNYPNPFASQTTMRFALPASGPVKLGIYNLLGQRVKALVDGHYQVGHHTIALDASGLPSGPYFYVLEAAGKRIVRKMTRVQ